MANKVKGGLGNPRKRSLTHMNTRTFDGILQCFSHLPLEDRRTKISPKEFVLALVFALVADYRKKSIASLRRGLIELSSVSLQRGAFWERLATKRLFFLLCTSVQRLIQHLAGKHGGGRRLLQQLKVKSILILDASTITLTKKRASAHFPAPPNNGPAGIKWHICLNALSGVIKWFSLSSAAENERRHLPPLSTLKGSLLIADLGYWHYQFYADLAKAGGFYLSRVMKKAKIEITGIPTKSRWTKGERKLLLNGNLFDFDWTRKRHEIIDLMGTICLDRQELKEFDTRIVGFWNEKESTYHWYITNLSVPAQCIRTIYRIRWQVELAVRGSKSILKIDDIPSSNEMIIRNIFLLTVIAYLVAEGTFQNLAERQEQDLPRSIQRPLLILKHIYSKYYSYLATAHQAALESLRQAIALFSHELFDPNYKRRRNTSQMLADLLY